jgi:4-oxalocrotonate tautomerase
MPLAQIFMAPGRTDEQKAQLIERVTQAFTETVGVPADSVWITIQEVPRTQWGVAGQTLAAKK